MAAKHLRLAADTNVLLDLADEVEDVLDAIALIDHRVPNADWLVPPGVLDELGFLHDSGQTQSVRQSAGKAIKSLRGERRFRPILELPFGEDLADTLTEQFLAGGLLPAEEVHDSAILAEAVLLDCAILLSSDAHLRTIDHEALTLMLRPHDLVAPVIATPREIVRKFFR